MIHSRVVWMFRPVERSITVSAPQRMAQTSLSTSSATPEVTAELPMLALILTRKLRPIAIGSLSGWLTLFGMMARPRATSSRTNSGVTWSGMAAPKLSPSRFAASRQPRPPEVLPDRHVLHLRRDDAGARVGQLRHRPPRLRAQGLPAGPVEHRHLARLARLQPVILRPRLAPGVALDVAARLDPRAAQFRQAARGCPPAARDRCRGRRCRRRAPAPRRPTPRSRAWRRAAKDGARPARAACARPARGRP